MTHFKMDQIKVEQFAILEDKLPQDEIDFSAELMHGASKEDKVIAGSALTMLKAVQNLVKWGYPLEYALQAANTNPANRFGLNLSIKPGCEANFIVLDKKTLSLKHL